MRLPCLLGAIVAASFTAMAVDSTDFTLHEWGTFTSISGSGGVLLPGLEREEEALPMFVQSHEGMLPQVLSGGKGWARPLHNVTIKMETPVIYFYTSQPFRAHVHVEFNGGSISQWFPARSDGETPPPHSTNAQGAPIGGDIDFAKGFKGDIQWDVQVQPPSADDSAAVFKDGETLTWVYPRQTDAALVRTQDGAAEKFLFYRGVGNFSLPVRFTLPDDDTVHIENRSDAVIPSVLIFNHTLADKVSFAMLGQLEAGQTRSVNLSARTTSTNWRHEVYGEMKAVLVRAGLFQKEADAMLQTWWRSYFERPSLCAFWIAPETFTRSILPLAVEPSPRQQTRVLVGRSELLTPSFEKELLAQFAKGEQNSWRYDRYFLAYGARVNGLKSGR